MMIKIHTFYSVWDLDNIYKLCEIAWVFFSKMFFKNKNVFISTVDWIKFKVAREYCEFYYELCVENSDLQSFVCVLGMFVL